MSIRAAIYGRSSPDCPLTDDQQIDRLKAVVDEHGWMVARVFTDRPTSIRKGLDRRPGEAALLDAIRNGEIDMVCISSICRVGKTVPDLVSFLETCRSADVSWSRPSPAGDHGRMVAKLANRAAAMVGRSVIPSVFSRRPSRGCSKTMIQRFCRPWRSWRAQCPVQARQGVWEALAAFGCGLLPPTLASAAGDPPGSRRTVGQRTAALPAN